jgi:hypothetical protein
MDLFMYDENLPGIARKNWWDERPKVGEKDFEDFFEVERAWVLDKATRHCMSWHEPSGCHQPDMARGWAIRQNGQTRTVSETEFAKTLAEMPDEMVKAQSCDGFWAIKI